MAQSTKSFLVLFFKKEPLGGETNGTDGNVDAAGITRAGGKR
jgi:hypothetical protein